MNAYLERLQQLAGEKQQIAASRFSPYLNRPMSNNPQQQGSPLPPEKPEEELPPEADMNSMFGMNFQEFANQDQRFGQMLDEFSQLAMGLGEQVKQGFMPEAIAKKRLQSYVQDTAGYFQKNEPTIMDNPKMNAVMEQMFNNAMEKQNQEGQPDLEQAVDPMAAQVQQEGGM